MRYLKTLGLVASAIMATAMMLAGSAGATILTSPAGTTVKAGTAIKAESEAAVSLHGSIDTICQKSTMEGSISNAGGSEATVSGAISKLTFTECGPDTVTIIKNGSLEVHWTSGNNGKIRANGTEVTILVHRKIFEFPITTHCIYRPEGTDLGTFTGSSATKATATLDIASALIPQVETDGACGEEAIWTGNYKVTSPDYLDADSGSEPHSTPDPGTILTSAAGTKAAVGTKIKTESEGAIEFSGTIPFSCQKSAMEGEISNAGGEATTVSASLSSFTFSECGNHTVTVLKPGSLEIHNIGGGKGTLTSTGAEITVLTHGVFLGTRHCIYTTNKTDIGTITGSSATGATAKLDIGPAATPQTATDANCGSAEWGGSYKVTSPDYLDVDPAPTGAGSLTSPAGTKAAVGTKIKTESEGAIEFVGATPINCQKSAMEGEITNTGSESVTASVSLTSLTFTSCGNHTVTVLKPGSLEIHSTGSGKGTLTSTGAEITVLTHGVFLGTRHCIYTTNKTDIGTFTGSNATGGATAKLDIGPAATPQAVTDAACGSNAEWGGSYKVTSPDYLAID